MAAVSTPDPRVAHGAAGSFAEAPKVPAYGPIMSNQYCEIYSALWRDQSSDAVEVVPSQEALRVINGSTRGPSLSRFASREASLPT